MLEYKEYSFLPFDAKTRRTEAVRRKRRTDTDDKKKKHKKYQDIMVMKVSFPLVFHNSLLLSFD